MTGWTVEDANGTGSRTEVRVSARRSDGPLMVSRMIRMAEDANRLFIRSTNGRTAGWFRAATAYSRGVICAGGQAVDAAFVEAAEADISDVGAGYRRKHGRHASIVDHLEETAPLCAILEVHSA